MGISCTVTCGAGNEAHNHDLEYRETLEHVHGRPDGVIEIIPYRSYKEQINEYMRPYIEAYNKGRDAAYQEAWERYNAGERKTKPRRREFAHMGYDYYTEHMHDRVYNQHDKTTQERDMWRSVIIGLGDKYDRLQGNITEEQAKAILAEVAAKFREDFPDFLLLGCSLHLDEEGFFHAHFDYKPVFIKKTGDTRELAVGTGFDAALEKMGFKREQSIINGKDKAPLLFNAFRNRIYKRVEEAMNAQGLRLEYGVTARKQPGHDPSTNEPLEVWQSDKDRAWQQTQEKMQEAQAARNEALDILDEFKDGEVTAEAVGKAIQAATKGKALLQEVEGSPMTVTRNGVKVSFSLFDQLKSFVAGVVDVLVTLMREVSRLTKQLHREEDYSSQLEGEIDALRGENSNLQQFKAEAYNLRVDYRNARQREDRLEHEVKKQRDFMSRLQVKDGSTVLDAYEAQEALQRRQRQEWSR